MRELPLKALVPHRDNGQSCLAQYLKKKKKKKNHGLIRPWSLNISQVYPGSRLPLR